MGLLLVSLLNLVFQIFSFLVLIEVVGSWILAARVHLPDWAYGVLTTVHRLTAPVLEPLRRILPSVGGLDLSPLIALFLLDVLRRLVTGLLAGVR